MLSLADVRRRLVVRAAPVLPRPIHLNRTVTGTSPTLPSRPRVVIGVGVGLMAAVVALATGVLFGWRYASSGTAPVPTVRFEVLPPTGIALRPSPVVSAAQLALSPDGRHLAFIAATKGGSSQIWVRPLDSVQAQPLAGTEGASFPFWSPDSRFIAFSLRASSRRSTPGATHPRHSLTPPLVAAGLGTEKT